MHTFVRGGPAAGAVPGPCGISESRIAVRKLLAGAKGMATDLAANLHHVVDALQDLQTLANGKIPAPKILGTTSAHHIGSTLLDIPFIGLEPNSPSTALVDKTQPSAAVDASSKNDKKRSQANGAEENDQQHKQKKQKQKQEDKAQQQQDNQEQQQAAEESAPPSQHKKKKDRKAEQDVQTPAPKQQPQEEGKSTVKGKGTKGQETEGKKKKKKSKDAESA